MFYCVHFFFFLEIKLLLNCVKPHIYGVILIYALIMYLYV